MFEGQGDRGGRGGGMGFMPFFSPWMLVARMLGGGPTEKVDHNPVTQILIPCLRALMGGAGICIVITGYVSASYVWHRNVALNDLGRVALPLLVFGLSGVISAAIGIFHDPPENYWGSRQSMFLIFGVASFALCYAFAGIAVKDPEGVLFWEIVESSCFIGLATVGFLLAIWGIIEQLIVYQMTESQRTGWGVIKRRLDERIPTGAEAAGEPEEIIKEWRISVTMTPKKDNGQNGRPIGPKMLHFDPRYVTDDKVAFWAASVLAGEDIGYPTWVATKRFGRRAYDHLMEVLTAKQYVAKRGTARNAKLFLTVEGKRVLALWLAAYDRRAMGDDEPEAGDLEYEDDGHTYKGDWDVDERPANST